jgi:proteasome lid subunit RPN8/RPN11
MSSKTVKVKVKTQPVVVMEAEVARKIRQHSRTSMKAEVCGVLIGSTEDDRTLIEACIAGVNAAQGGAHVTFTQDTWEHIYKIKDEEFPEKKIVGWYHSHPGFGVFLSEHDLFIHENFFSSPQQVAWVYDPHTDEEGCFGWIGGKTEKLNGVRFGYSQSIDIGMTGSASGDQDHDEDPQINSSVKVYGEGRVEDREPAWVKWAGRAMMVVAALSVGFALGYMFMMRHADQYILRQLDQMAPALAMCQQVVENPVKSCQQILHAAGVPSGSGAPSQLQDPLQPAPPHKQPVNSKPQASSPTKDNHGQH